MGLKGVPGIRYVKPQVKDDVDASQQPPSSYSSALQQHPGVLDAPTSEPGLTPNAKRNRPRLEQKYVKKAKEAAS